MKTGWVKCFDKDKGFGFIRTKKGKEFFFHHSAIQMDGFRLLDSDDIVEFDTEVGTKGVQAVNVKPILTLAQMKQKAEERGLHLVAAQDSYRMNGWIILDENDNAQNYGYVNTLADLDYYFEKN